MSFIRAHSLLILLIASTAFTFFWLCYTGNRINLRKSRALPVAILFILSGVFSVSSLAVLEQGTLTAWKQNSVFGAFLFLPVLLYLAAIITRRKVALVEDIFAVCTAFTLFLMRINCVIAGCCLGRFIGDTGIRWPIRGIEIIYYFLFMNIMGGKVLREKTHGEVYPLFMITYGCLRFVLQFAREEYQSIGFLHLSHVWAIISITVGAILLHRIRRNR